MPVAKQWLVKSAVFTSLISVQLSMGVFQETVAATPRQQVSGVLSSLSGHTTQLVQQVQAFLQASGRWAPAPVGADMQLCQALQSFQQSVSLIIGDNAGKPLASIQTDFRQLQAQSGAVEQLINQTIPSPLVAAAWMQVRNDLISINQSLYSVPTFNPGNFYDLESGLATGSTMLQGGMPGTTFSPGVMPGMPFNPSAMSPGMPFSPYYPGMGYYPGFRPTNINITENSTFDPTPSFQGGFSNFIPPVAPGTAPGFAPQIQGGHINTGVLSGLNTADNQSERFSKQLAGFLATKGKWPPPAGSPEMQLCQNLQTLQKQIRKVKNDLEANIYSTVQLELQQTGTTSQSIDQLLVQIGATPDVLARWNEVRAALNNSYQAFFSAGAGPNWVR